MPIAKTHCAVCKQPAVVATTSTIDSSLFTTYQCGHTDIQKKISASDFSDFVSMDVKRPYPFQITGAVFGSEQANGRVLIMDEQGLGKTVQFLMMVKSHPKELTRFLLLCKAGLKAQWSKEIPRWCGEDYVPQILESENDYIMPGVKGLILSFDTLWRFKDIPAFMKRARIKFVGLDEVQHIKNTNSKRTNGVREAVAQVKYVAGLSGTPIKNNAGEFFPILNMLRPDIPAFRTKSIFDQTVVDTYYDGHKLKYGGLKSAQKFKELTKDFIIRRTRQEVLPELPVITRDYRYSQLGPIVEEAYKDTFKQFQNYSLYGGVSDSAAERAANILAYLTKMRHITGIAKIEPCLDFVADFIEETDRKIV